MIFQNRDTFNRSRMGFFEVLDRIVEAIENKRFARTEIPEYPELSRGFIVEGADIPEEENALDALARFLAHEYSLQMTAEERDQESAKLVCIVKQEGRKYLYFETLDQKTLDTDIIKRHIEAYRASCMEYLPSDPENDCLFLGPFPHRESRAFFVKLLETIGDFSVSEPIEFSLLEIDSPDGLYFKCDRASYENLFKNEPFNPLKAIRTRYGFPLFVPDVN